MAKLFFDTEFTGLHQFTTLISLGIVAESGETFYAEFTDYDPLQVDSWIKENVIDKLRLTDKIKVTNSSWENWISDNGVYSDALDFTLAQKDMKEFECIGATPMIKNRLEKWLSQFEKIEMWSDCLAYDWVLFCNIFGHAFQIPKNIFYIPFDISTHFKQCGFDPDINRESFAGAEDMALLHGLKHNSLWDAKIIKACYEKLNVKKSDEPYEPYFGWCDVEGCENEGCSGGNAWRKTGYWTVCYKHSADFREGKPKPQMKQSAIDREASRGEDGCLTSPY